VLERWPKSDSKRGPFHTREAEIEAIDRGASSAIDDRRRRQTLALELTPRRAQAMFYQRALEVDVRALRFAPRSSSADVWCLDCRLRPPLERPAAAVPLVLADRPLGIIGE
jgi:hypothetical protein